MDRPLQKITKEQYPPGLLEIPDVPDSLYILGAPLDPAAKYLAVVGSRAHTSYGADACDALIRGLTGSDIVIVSGLALGIDSVAHRSALKAGLKTVAFPGSGLDDRALYPATNLSLAKEILAAGGTLVSEFEPNQKPQEYFFPKRNRLMAGIAQAVLVIEAADKSGTLITAHIALDYNRELLAVPGPITNPTSLGTNLLIKQGATPVTRSQDILEVFGMQQAELSDERDREIQKLTVQEKAVYDALIEPLSRDTLIALAGLPAQQANILLSALEIKGLVREEYGLVRRV